MLISFNTDLLACLISQTVSLCVHNMMTHHYDSMALSDGLTLCAQYDDLMIHLLFLYY